MKMTSTLVPVSRPLCRSHRGTQSPASATDPLGQLPGDTPAKSQTLSDDRCPARGSTGSTGYRESLNKLSETMIE
jgi:hypothetical protein